MKTVEINDLLKSEFEKINQEITSVFKYWVRKEVYLQQNFRGDGNQKFYFYELQLQKNATGIQMNWRKYSFATKNCTTIRYKANSQPRMNRKLRRYHSSEFKHCRNKEHFDLIIEVEEMLEDIRKKIDLLNNTRRNFIQLNKLNRFDENVTSIIEHISDELPTFIKLKDRYKKK